MTLVAIIQTGNARYVKQCHWAEVHKAIWTLCAETMKQLESEQWILAQGFKKQGAHEKTNQ